MAKKKYPNIQWRDGVAQLLITINGTRYRESLHTSNSNEAIERRDTRIAELRKGIAAESVSWTTPGAPLPKYKTVREFADLDIERQRKDGSSEEVIKSGLFAQWKRICFTFRTVDEITDAAVQKYYYDQRGAGMMHSSIKRDIPLLRRCSAWAHSHHPDVDVLLWKVPRQSTRVLHEKSKQAGEAHDLDKLKKWFGSLSVHARAQALLVVTTGLRGGGEVRRVTPKMLKPLQGYGEVTHILEMPTEVTKGGIPRRVAVTAPVARILQELCESGVLRKNYKKQFAAHGLKVLGDVVHLRDLRHTFKKLAGPVDADATKLAMGHKTGDRDAGNFYVHLDDDRLAKIARPVAAEFKGLIASLFGVATAD